MSSAAALWWLALPLLLLPVWWHRQKRQRTQSQPLATARFLPASAPQQLRIWRWADLALLALRLLLLLGVIAWLADALWPWRGDTVFVGARADPAWAEAQIQAAGWSAAQRIVFCPEDDAAPPLASAGGPKVGCDLRTGDLLGWLAVHQREWRAAARLAVVATGDGVTMAAHAPLLTHAVDLRLQPVVSTHAPATASATAAASAPAGTTVVRHVVLASARAAAWRGLFAAFENAGLGRDRYRVVSQPDAQTELIVWDRPEAPDPAWRAPLWWAVRPAAFPELAQARRTGGVRVVDTARGRIWAQDAWPLDAVDPLPAARTLFEDTQLLQHGPAPYPPPSMTLAASAAAPQPVPSGATHPLLAPLLAVLFALERLLAHRLQRAATAAPAAATP